MGAERWAGAAICPRTSGSIGPLKLIFSCLVAALLARRLIGPRASKSSRRLYVYDSVPVLVLHIYQDALCSLIEFLKNQ